MAPHELQIFSGVAPGTSPTILSLDTGNDGSHAAPKIIIVAPAVFDHTTFRSTLSSTSKSSAVTNVTPSRVAVNPLLSKTKTTSSAAQSLPVNPAAPPPSSTLATTTFSSQAVVQPTSSVAMFSNMASASTSTSTALIPSNEPAADMEQGAQNAAAPGNDRVVAVGIASGAFGAFAFLVLGGVWVYKYRKRSKEDK